MNCAMLNELEDLRYRAGVLEKQRNGLLAALKGIEQMIGWQGGHSSTGPLVCEYCLGTDEETPETVKHNAGCPVLAVFAAIAEASK